VTEVSFLDLSRHVATLRPEIEAAIGGVLDGGRFVGGEPVERFEREFAVWVGAEHAVGVASGTDAIELALGAVGVGEGDEVITVANTCIPTVAGIEASGATPVLVDAQQGSMTIDPERVAAAVGPRTRAIVPVHLYGRCADMDAILAIAAEHGLKVVEDCAQAHGATWAGRRAGTMGDAAAFSFYPTKNLGALGEGGAVTTSDAALADRVRRLRDHGQAGRHDHVEIGYNARLDSIQCACLAIELRRLDEANTKRRALATRYRANLGGDARVRLVAEAPGSAPVYHLMIVRVDAGRRDAVRDAMGKAGVATAIHYPTPIHQQRAYAHLRQPPCPIAERAAREMISLPMYPDLTVAMVDRVCEVLLASR
jgi:dTDP-4-amino-4,6-dideoxygalactose transaminase